MKKLTTLLFTSIFICSTALAQNSQNQASQDTDGNNNIATITQAKAAGSEASVKQEGDRNSSTIIQDGYLHNASLYNVGDENIIRQSQYGTNNQQRVELWGDKNEFTTFQEGEDNFIYLNTRGTDPGLFGRPSNGSNNNENSANIRQDGYRNLFSGSVTGSNNEVSVEQTGRYNKIGGALFDVPTLSLQSSQTGVFGFLQSLFNGDAWSANGVNIYGDNNKVSLKQAGFSNANYAFIEGDNNQVTQRMTDGTDNTILQATIGSDNKSILELWGDNNIMLTGQKGSGNQLFLNTRGTGTGFTNGGGNSSNLFVALQLNDDNFISGGIDGSHNEIGIVQFGSQNMVGSNLYAADGLRVMGDDNTVHIGQYGYGNTASTSVVGNYNTATIQQ